MKTLRRNTPNRNKTLIFDKGKKPLNGERVLKQLDITCKKINPDTNFTTSTKINSKWITDLNVKCTTINLEDNMKEN